eukprot:SAG11_NODE_5570_length_1521_cov_1.797468_2_plen_62_part_01
MIAGTKGAASAHGVYSSSGTPLRFLPSAAKLRLEERRVARPALHQRELHDVVERHAARAHDD